MSTVEVNCLVQGGDLRHACTVEIPSTKNVSALKHAIWTENQHAFKGVDAATLVLWKVPIPTDSLLERDPRILNLDEDQSLMPMDRLSKVFLGALDEDQHHLPVSTRSLWPDMTPPPLVSPSSDSSLPSLSPLSTSFSIHAADQLVAAATGKKRTFQEGNDEILLLIQRWKEKRAQRIIPSLDELAGTLNQALADEEKIPLPQELYDSFFAAPDRCHNRDVGAVFRVENSISDLIISDFYSPLIRQPPPREVTEDSFHQSGITTCAEFYCCCTETRARSAIATFTQRRVQDVDFSFIVKGDICIFRGEERAYSSREDPKAELSAKLCWVYSLAPYILGYYCQGTDLTYVAISPPSNGHSFVHDILKVDLDTKAGHLTNLRYLINLSALFDPLAELVDVPDAEFQLMERQEQADRSSMHLFTLFHMQG